MQWRSLVLIDWVRNFELQARTSGELTRQTLIVRESAVVGDLLFKLISFFEGLLARDDADPASATGRIPAAGVVEREPVFESDIEYGSPGAPKIDRFPFPALFYKEKED